MPGLLGFLPWGQPAAPPPPPPPSPMMRLLLSIAPADVAAKMAIDFGLVAAVFALLYALSPRNWPRKQRAFWALKAVSIVHAVVVSAASIYSLFWEPSMAEVTKAVLRMDAAAARPLLLHNTSDVAAAVVPLTLAYFIFDLLLVPVWEGTLKQHLPVFMHHGLSLLTWPVGLCHPTCQWFLLCCVSMEFSTPAVQLRWFIAQHWGKDTRLYVANGLAMVLGFKLCRILPMAHNLWAIWHSAPHAAPELPAHVRAAASVLILPNLLNLFWFYLMCRGLVALAGGGGGGKKRQQKDEGTKAKALIGDSGEQKVERLKAA